MTALFCGRAFADEAAVRLLASSELSSERQRRLVVAAEVALKELSGFQVKQSSGREAVVSAPKGARKTCVQELNCALELAKTANVRHVLLLSAKTDDGQLVLDAQLVDVEDRRGIKKQVEEGNASEPEVAVKGLVEQILPAWARKGWGGVSIADVTDTVKVDGLLLDEATKKQPLALPSGRHDVDVLLDDGTAVLQRLEVSEGSRARVSSNALPSAQLGESGSAGVGALRYVGYGTWTAGVLCVAGSLIAGALANQTLSTVRACEGTDRSCTSAPSARDARQRAEGYAGTGNVLLGVGVGLSAVGAGLVTFDLVQ